MNGNAETNGIETSIVDERRAECGRATVALRNRLLNPNVLHMFEPLDSFWLYSLPLAPLPVAAPPRHLALLEVGWRRARQLYNKSTNTNARFLEA